MTRSSRTAPATAPALHIPRNLAEPLPSMPFGDDHLPASPISASAGRLPYTGSQPRLARAAPDRPTFAAAPDNPPAGGDPFDWLYDPAVSEHQPEPQLDVGLPLDPAFWEDGPLPSLDEAPASLPRPGPDDELIDTVQALGLGLTRLHGAQLSIAGHSRNLRFLNENAASVRALRFGPGDGQALDGSDLARLSSHVSTGPLRFLIAHADTLRALRFGAFGDEMLDKDQIVQIANVEGSDSDFDTLVDSLIALQFLRFDPGGNRLTASDAASLCGTRLLQVRCRALIERGVPNQDGTLSVRIGIEALRVAIVGRFGPSQLAKLLALPPAETSRKRRPHFYGAPASKRASPAGTALSDSSLPGPTLLNLALPERTLPDLSGIPDVDDLIAWLDVPAAEDSSLPATPAPAQPAVPSDTEALVRQVEALGLGLSRTTCASVLNKRRGAAGLDALVRHAAAVRELRFGPANRALDGRDLTMLVAFGGAPALTRLIQVAPVLRDARFGPEGGRTLEPAEICQIAAHQAGERALTMLAEHADCLSRIRFGPGWDCLGPGDLARLLSSGAGVRMGLLLVRHAAAHRWGDVPFIAFPLRTLPGVETRRGSEAWLAALLEGPAAPSGWRPGGAEAPRPTTASQPRLPVPEPNPSTVTVRAARLSERPDPPRPERPVHLLPSRGRECPSPAGQDEIEAMQALGLGLDSEQCRELALRYRSRNFNFLKANANTLRRVRFGPGDGQALDGADLVRLLSCNTCKPPTFLIRHAGTLRALGFGPFGGQRLDKSQLIELVSVANFGTRVYGRKLRPLEETLEHLGLLCCGPRGDRLTTSDVVALCGSPGYQIATERLIACGVLNRFDGSLAIPIEIGAVRDAIAHRDGGRRLTDLVREIRPPGSTPSPGGAGAERNPLFADHHSAATHADLPEFDNLTAWLDQG